MKVKRKKVKAARYDDSPRNSRYRRQYRQGERIGERTMRKKQHFTTVHPDRPSIV